MDAKIKQAAALDWATHTRAQQSGLDQVYVTLMNLWIPLIDEIKASGRYADYLRCCEDYGMWIKFIWRSPKSGENETAEYLEICEDME